MFIPYSFTHYKNSVLATIVGGIGTLLWVVGATFLIAGMKFAIALLSFIGAMVFSFVIAPLIATLKDAKQQGYSGKISLRDLLFEKKVVTIVFLVLSLLMVAASVYQVGVNVYDQQLQDNPCKMEEASTEELVSGRFVEEEFYSFIPSFAYTGDTFETADCLYSAVMVTTADGGYCVPVRYDPKYYDQIEEISVQFVEFINSEPDSLESYSGGSMKLIGRTVPIKMMESDIYSFYLEALEYHYITDFAAPFYINLLDEYPAIPHLFYQVLLVVSCVLLAFAIYCNIILLMTVRKAKQAKIAASEHHIEL